MAEGNEQRIWAYHDGVSLLRVELFYDDEAGNWHYRAPAVHINGGGTSTREGAERASVDVSVATPAA
jgi:hypothetical protein